MSRHKASLPPGYFDALYATDPDPWRFATSGYERAKYIATLAALPRPHYAAALEVGCSIGVLTLALAKRCAALLAVDVAEAALVQARRRCTALPNVRFAMAQVPQAWPSGTFDLILLSEVVYYLERSDVTWLARRVGASLRPAGHVVLVHWTGATNYPLSGDAAAGLFIQDAASFAQVRHQARTKQYRLDVLEADAS